MRFLKENLLVQFSVASFLILAMISVLLAIALSNKVRSDAVNDLVDEAVGASSGRLLSFITPADLEVPMKGERYDRFHTFVQQSIVSERTARVKLWSKDGTVIYSNDPTGVGEKFPTKENLLRALNGVNAIEIKIPNDADNAGERHLGTLMEVYTPIYFPGGSEPAGAFEIYQYYGPTAQRINDLRRWIFGSIGVGFLVLYGSLVTIVWRGWRTMTKQQSQLESINIEHGLSVEGLREANERLEAEITERKRAEAQLKAFAADLERSNRELQEFAYVASHDLQEPLRKVEAFGDRLRVKYGDALTGQGQDYLERMLNASGRMRTLINDLLSLSRVTTRAQPFVPVDLAGLAAEVVSDLETTIDQAGGRVEVGHLPTIEADPTQVRLLLQNLVSNALKFRRPGEPPVVKVYQQFMGNPTSNGDRIYSDDDFCQVVVEDNGIGFDEKYLDRIFNVFQRLHGRDKYEGTGVGLAVCRKIAERHGGSITARSEPGQGAKLIVTLPTRQPEGESKQRANGAKPSLDAQ